tara:strand:+ start:139 stop:1032 length:894 start_codon:yes stop_codon:yes gene_type:complete
MILNTKKIPFDIKDNLIKKFILKYLASKSAKRNKDNLHPVAVFNNEWIGANMFVDGVYEKKFIQDIFDILYKIKINPNKGYALDIGANIGNHSIQFSKKFKGVIAFEPHQKIFEILKFNTKNLKNIKCINSAVGEKKGTVKFRDYPENYGATHVLKNHIKKNYFKVNISKLSDLVKKIKIISYIKIDTEGMEFEILKGGKEIIQKFKPVISLEQKKIEFKSKFNETPSIDFLRQMGYRIFIVKENFKTNNFLFKKLVIIFSSIIKVNISREIIELKNVRKKDYNFLIAIHDKYLNLH